MKYCPECGQKLKIGIKFCSQCGFKLAGLKSTKKEDTVTRKTRFINAIIDNWLGLSICGYILGFFGGVFGFIPEDMSDDGWIVFGVFVYFFYYIFTEYFTGKTLGKLMTGTKVVLEDGSKPLFSTLFIRTLVRLIPFEAFSFLNKDVRGWHDKWSRTRVIKG